MITSSDGQIWSPAALIWSPTADLRDPKITIIPDKRLMLSSAGALHVFSEQRHQSMAWFSDNGMYWSEPTEVGDFSVWLWRVIWHNGTAYGIGYSTTNTRFIRLYTSSGGVQFDTLVEKSLRSGLSE